MEHLERSDISGIGPAESDGFPRFFHLGTQRAGSSYLYNLLKSHPQVSLSALQETRYFSRRFHQGDEWYLGTFPPRGIRIDTSPDYFLNASVVAPRILDKLGPTAPRFSVFLRNPVDYLYSRFRMASRAGYLKTNSLASEVSLSDFLSSPTGNDWATGYCDALAQWLRYFAPAQLMVVIFERFVRAPQEGLDSLCQFYGLDSVSLSTPISSKNTALRSPFLYWLKRKTVKRRVLRNVLKSSRVFNWAYDRFLVDHDRASREERLAIAEVTREDVSQLRVLLGEDIPEWQDYVK